MQQPQQQPKAESAQQSVTRATGQVVVEGGVSKPQKQSPPLSSSLPPLSDDYSSTSTATVDTSAIEDLRRQRQQVVSSSTPVVNSLLQEAISKKQACTDLEDAVKTNLVLFHHSQEHLNKVLTDLSDLHRRSTEMNASLFGHGMVIRSLQDILRRETALFAGKQVALKAMNALYVPLLENDVNQVRKLLQSLSLQQVHALDSMSALASDAKAAAAKAMELQEQATLKQREAEEDVLRQASTLQQQRVLESMTLEQRAAQEAQNAASAKAQEEASRRASMEAAEQEAKARALAEESSVTKTRLLLEAEKAKAEAMAKTQAASQDAAKAAALSREGDLLKQEQEKSRSFLSSSEGKAGVAGAIGAAGILAASAAGGTGTAAVPKQQQQQQLLPLLPPPILLPISESNAGLSPMTLMWMPGGVLGTAPTTTTTTPTTPTTTTPTTSASPSFFLHARIRSALLNTSSSSFPQKVVVRASLGNIIALSTNVLPIHTPTPSPTPTVSSISVPLGVFATLPIYSSTFTEKDVFAIDLLDASGSSLFQEEGDKSKNLSAMGRMMMMMNNLPLLGRSLVIIDQLKDGHLSRNSFKLSPPPSPKVGGAPVPSSSFIRGGLIETELQVVPGGEGGGRSGVSSSSSSSPFPQQYSWQRGQDTPFWFLTPLAPPQPQESIRGFDNKNYSTTSTGGGRVQVSL